MRRTALGSAAILLAGAVSGSWALSAAAATAPRLSIGDVRVIEGHSSYRSAVLSVALSRPTDRNVTFSYRTGNGTARATSDYAARSGRITILAGRSSALVKVPVMGDTRHEAHETIKVRLTSATNATLYRSLGTATIVNDDTTPTTPVRVSVGDASLVEGDSGGRYLHLPLTLSAKATGTVSIRYRTVSSSARSPSDFVARSSTARIPAGATGTTIAVVVKGDTAVEATETFTIQLTAAAGARLARTTGTAKILNDDRTPPPTTAAPTTTTAAPTTTTTAAPTTTTTAGPPAGSTMWGWGDNERGQLGDGTLTDRLSPVQAGGATDWTAVDGGWLFSCGTRAGNTAWCWGDFDYGRLGDGTGSPRTGPVQVGNEANWATVSAGSYHACGTRTDGTLWCWGRNQHGEIGDGTTTQRNGPVRIGNETNWATISAGDGQTCGTRTDGTAWCWGRNNYGGLGDGTTVQRLNPTQVGSDTNWATVGASGDHACGLRTDGTVWCWGLNGYGQLGDGTTTERHLPVQVGASNTWTSVTVGALGHTCGRRAGGTAWCWGWNDYGQLGDGTTTSRSSPVQVGNATDWATLSAGGAHTCGLRTGGTAWCWGLNGEGQVGAGSEVLTRTSPFQVGNQSDWIAVGPGGSHSAGIRST